MERRERRERREQEEERRVEAEELGAGEGGTAIPPATLLYGVHGRGVRGGLRFPLFSLFLGFFSFVIPWVRVLYSWDRPGWRAKWLATSPRTGRREFWIKSAPQ